MLKSQIESFKFKSDNNHDLENEINKLKLMDDKNKEIINENLKNLNEEKSKNELSIVV